MNTKIVVAAGCAALMLGACGTITRGTKDTWVIETTPAGASVSTSNGFSCRSTPCALKMPRRSEFVATIEMDGYETHEIQVTSQVSGQGGAAMAGNVLVGGIIGAGIDAGSGAMYDLVPNPVQVTLNPLRAGAVPVAAPAEEPALEGAADEADAEAGPVSR